MNRLWSAAAAILAVLPMNAGAADDAPAPIREFDIPTIETLGRQMYAQDQEAWKATDVLLARHADAELRAQKIHGWIVVRLDGHDVVRFIRDGGGGGPELFYDVTFVGDAAPVLSEPQNRSLTAEEAAQYRARLWPEKNQDVKCTGRLNTIALKDPEKDGWLVWGIAATTDPSVVVLGGTVRYTISADGTTVIRKDALALSCGVVPKPQPPAGSEEVGTLWTHIVSLTPVETQVFAGLNYAMDIFIETTDGRTWKLSKGHISSADMDSPDMGGYAARILAGHMEECSAVVDKSGDGKGGFVISKDAPQVILETEDKAAISVPVPESGRVAEIACRRLDIVPAPNDYKSLRSGYPLYILDVGTGHPKRAGTLEVVNGKVVFFLSDKDPPLTDEQQARVTARLDAFQKALSKKD